MTTTPAPSITTYPLVGSALGPFPTGWPYADAADVTVRLRIGGDLQPPLQSGRDYSLSATQPLSGGGPSSGSAWCT